MFFDITIIDSYKTKNHIQKLRFWDSQLPLCKFEKNDLKKLVSFIRQIMDNPQEAIYFKCKAIDFSIRMFLSDILKARNILDILLDSWISTGDVHLETLRIRRLALLYPYDTEIQSVLYELAKNDSLVSANAILNLSQSLT